MPVDPQLLDPIPFFAPFDREERTTLAGALHLVHLPAGQTLFAAGDPGDAMYIVRSGEAETAITDNTGTRIVLDTLQPGDFFGEIALLHPGPRTATVLATHDLEALEMDRPGLEHCLKLQPTLALTLLTVLAERLRTTDLRLQHTATRNVNEQFRDSFSRLDRLALLITTRVGTFGFFLIIFAWTVFWLGYNLVAPEGARFDPAPAFVLWLFISNMIQIFLMPLIMVGQNLQGRHAELRAENDFEINQQAELEVAALHEKMDSLRADVLKELHQLRRESRAARGV